MSCSVLPLCLLSIIFFFNAPTTTAIYTLSLHDALPICPFPTGKDRLLWDVGHQCYVHKMITGRAAQLDRKSTRLNSSHTVISYAVFCLKKKNQIQLVYMGRYAIKPTRLYVRELWELQQV